MRNSRIMTRLMAILLATAMLLPASGFALDDTGAAEPAEPAAVEEAVTETEEEQVTEGGSESEPEEPQTEEPEEEPAEPGFLQNIKIEENPTGTVDIRWDAFSGAEYYEVSSPGINGVARTVNCTQSFTGLNHGVVYDFIIKAFDSNGKLTAQGAISIRTVAYKINFIESQYRRLKSRNISPKRFKINLRTMIKEGRNGYSVVQGGCTDGTYAYYLMVSSKTQKGRVLKVRMKNNIVVARSKVLNICHGNGMTYDSKRKKLVVIARERRKQEITVIDASTLRISKQKNVRYDYYKNAGSDSLSSKHQQQGLAAIAYVKKYDCYIALERVYHNLLIFNPDTFQAIGMVTTGFDKKYPGTFQAMDADERYVYLLLSYYNKNGKKQPYNLILALDWNSEKLLPAVNASKSKDTRYIKKAWACSNSNNGMPDAVIRIKTKYEAENIYHTTDQNGREHFYMSEYHSHPVYKTVRKRVKVRGRWKRKKVKVVRYYNKDNYVYNLGII